MSRVSGNAPQTPDVSGMPAGTTNFAEHLRRRCQEIGPNALAAALDRLESPCVDEVSPTDGTIACGETPSPITDVDPLDIPFEEFAA
jgi:hypothetical protein